MVLVPLAAQVGAVLVIVGIAGVINVAALLNDADCEEVHVALPDVTV
jgi:hypothetical protein